MKPLPPPSSNDHLCSKGIYRPYSWTITSTPEPKIVSLTTDRDKLTSHHLSRPLQYAVGGLRGSPLNYMWLQIFISVSLRLLWVFFFFFFEKLATFPFISHKIIHLWNLFGINSGQNSYMLYTLSKLFQRCIVPYLVQYARAESLFRTVLCYFSQYTIFHKVSTTLKCLENLTLVPQQKSILQKHLSFYCHSKAVLCSVHSYAKFSHIHVYDEICAAKIATRCNFWRNPNNSVTKLSIHSLCIHSLSFIHFN